MSDGELPPMVASGVDGSHDRIVHAPRVAVVAAVLAAAFVYAVYAVHEVPERAIRLIGGKGHGVARYGGIVATWVPPPGLEPAAAELGDADPNLELRREGDHFIIELARVRQANAPDVVSRLSAGGGLEFREVIESVTVNGLVHLGLAGMEDDRTMQQEPLVELDQWRAEDGTSHTDWYLYGHDRDVLEQAFAEAGRRGWTPPPHTQIAVERLDPQPDMRDQRPAWRSYFVSTDAPLDGTAIANAMGSSDPNTGRPIIQLEFNRKGARAFGELTARIVGHKLATLIGGVVKSAPIIAGPIRGGHAWITMGGSDPVAQEHERDVLVDVLKVGSLPLGGQLRDASWVAPSETLRVQVAHVQLALLGGVLAFVLAWLLVRFGRPERARRDQLAVDATPQPLGRKLAWTGFALGIFALGTSVVAPGVNRVELAHLVSRGRWHLDLAQFSLFALGLAPLISAFVTIEIVASIVPRWRKLRDSLRGRRQLERATAIAAIIACSLQAYFVVTYLRALDGEGMIAVYNPHMFWPTVATLAAAPFVLAVLAGVITNRGLGNGYAVLFVWAWLWRTPWHDLADAPTAQLVLAAIGIVATAAIALALLGWTVRSPGRVALPIPTASVAPLHDGGGVLALLGSLAAFGVTMPVWLRDASSSLHGLVAGVLIVVVFTAVWAYAFARPGRRRRELVATGLQPADGPLWARGVLVSAAGLVALFTIALVRPPDMLGRLADPALVIIATATFADLAAEWRARRCTTLVAVWQLHDPLLVDATRSRLGLAGIPHFIRSTRMRTLLWMFGSYVPMTVFVPSAHAEVAYANLRAWLDP